MLCHKAGKGGPVHVSTVPLVQQSHSETMATQDSKIILLAPWWLSQPWFPHLLRPCVDHPCIIPYCRDLLSQPEFVLDSKFIPYARMKDLMQHYQAAGFSEEVSSLAAVPRRPSTNQMYNVGGFDLLTGPQDKELIRLVPQLLK